MNLTEYWRLNFRECVHIHEIRENKRLYGTLHCDAWQASRVILFEKLQAHLSLDDFARLDDDQKTAVILDLACKIPSIMKAIMYMWTDRFCV